MPPDVGTPSPQESLQFLNAELPHGGPSALPYAEGHRLIIRVHLIGLLEEFPSLQIKTDAFTRNDGTTATLLQAVGTIPMSYLKVTYNIPVTIWLPETYPKCSPLAFVTPTPDMIIKRSHRHVDSSGLISVPYLQGWVFPRSNLVDLVTGLSLIFGQDPPLYSKPPIRSSYQNMSPAHVRVRTIPVAHPPLPPSSSIGPSPAMACHHPYPPYTHPRPPSPPVPLSVQNDPSLGAFRRNAINILMERVQHDIAEVGKNKEMDMDKLVTTQALLRQREDQCEQGLRELQNEKEALEHQLQIVLTNTDVLETWLQANKKINMEFEIDDVLEPCDALSRQLLDSTTADLAIEDIFYSLDRAVQGGAVPVDAYLKHIRTFAREQFFHKAMAAKVRAAQAQRQINMMAAARASRYNT